MTSDLNLSPSDILLCRTLQASFGLAQGDHFYVNPQRDPERGDIIAAEVHGYKILAQYEVDHVLLNNASPCTEFVFLGVVEDVDL
jgi:hypothetical protein